MRRRAFRDECPRLLAPYGRSSRFPSNALGHCRSDSCQHVPWRREGRNLLDFAAEKTALALPTTGASGLEVLGVFQLCLCEPPVWNAAPPKRSCQSLESIFYE